jgi:hypothetical protein|tara:strand:- start:57 stop:341 length:285 start_codon:yes stop_codon:yes gene_type:complete
MKTFDFTKHKCKKIIFTIDSDYLDLVDCIGLDYQKYGSDLKIKIFLDSEEFKKFYDPDPYNFAFNTLNPELAESCSEAKIYNPTKKDYLEYEID